MLPVLSKPNEWATDAGYQHLYYQHLEDTTEHTLLVCPHEESHRIPTKKFVENRDFVLSDIEGFLCAPEDTPNQRADPILYQRMIAVATRSRQTFKIMV